MNFAWKFDIKDIDHHVFSGGTIGCLCLGSETLQVVKFARSARGADRAVFLVGRESFP